MQLILSHRQMVSFFKKISSLGIITIVIILYIKFEPPKPINFPLAVDLMPTNLKISNQNYEIILQNSIFEGVNKYLEPYKITADSAVKTSNNKYKLSQVSAKYHINNKNYLSIISTYGTIYDDNKSIQLSDNVKIFFGNLILNSDNIKINLLNKEVISNSEVDLLYRNSKIIADSFIAKDNGNIIVFTGNVMTKIHLSDFNDDFSQ